MAHMKCVCFLQPNDENLEALEAELKEPKYGEYYLCQSVFTIASQCSLYSTLSPGGLEQRKNDIVPCAVQEFKG